MLEWCIEHHGKSEITEILRQEKLTLAECETQVLDFLKKYTPPAECPLAGNNVSTAKRFLINYMPDVINHLSYKIMDVTSISRLVKHLYPLVPEKKGNHLALDDIRESIEELKYYRKVLFRNQITK